jgi:hypothetical protein
MRKSGFFGLFLSSMVAAPCVVELFCNIRQNAQTHLI